MVSIDPVQVSGVGSANGAAAQRLRQAASAASSEAAGFGANVSDALSGLATREQSLDAAARAAATGDLASVTDYMLVAAETQLATEVTVAVRDRAISAFNDIMRMQI